MTFKMRLRVREKATHRTWIVVWAPESGVIYCAVTGRKNFCWYRSGYGEYNDRGEPVLDSWWEPEQAAKIV
jgi:hypothetical protein